jgi:hypothetical protein
LRGTISRAIGACLVVVALAACGSDGDRSATEAVTQAPEGSRELRPGALAAGRYVAEAFAVPFSVDVPDGWRALEYRPEVVILGRGSEEVPEGEIPFRVVDRVYDPVTGRVRAAPADMTAWLRRHPRLEFRGVRPDELGGLPGARARVQAGSSATTAPGCDTPCVPIAPAASAEKGEGIAVGKGGVELLLLPLADGRTLVVHISAQASAFLPHAAELLRTVRFEYAS